MPRNLVFCSDGTGNSASSTTKTNVWRVYDALDRTDTQQLATFDDGVGTSSFRPLQIIGLVLGIGIKRNVLDLYKFLCRNYRDGDQLYGFGFSRGAFTIRIVAGLVSRHGLAPFKSDEQLDRDALAIYRHFRATAFRQPPVARVMRWLASPLRKPVLPMDMRTEYETTDATGQITKTRIAIRFLGLWDTVAAYGTPVDELTMAIDRWIWPMHFADFDLPDHVTFARQALALDDERRTFFPIPWVDKDKRPDPGAVVGSRRLVQAWFAGVHANVGGGYPDDRLALVPLNWIMQAADAQGLRFNQAKWDGYRAEASLDGPIYDSRSAFAAFYRYQPRSLHRLIPPVTGRSVPLLHESVIRRMADGADHYAPVSIDTTDFDVLDDTNTVIAFAPSKVAGGQIRAIDEAIGRLHQDAADQTGGTLVPGRIACMNRVRDLIWWGRALYFIMLVSALSAVSMVFWPAPSGGNWKLVNTAVADVLTPVWALSRMVLPASAQGLIAGFRENAIPAILILAILAFTYLYAIRIRTRIHDWSAARWNRSLRQGTWEVDRSQKRQQVSGLLRTTCWLAGATCVLAAGWLIVQRRGNDDLARGFLAVMAPFLAACVITCTAYVIVDKHKDGTDKDGLPYWSLLAFARWARCSPELRRGYRWLAKTGGPIAAITLVAGVAYYSLLRPLAQQAWFQPQVLLGMICTPTPDGSRARVLNPGDDITLPKPFEVSSRCWPSGLMLAEDSSYEITLTIPDDRDWFDRSIRTDVEGFSGSDFVHVAAFLSKRWLGQSWFKPIARIGATGATEFPLEPFRPVDPRPTLDVHYQKVVDDLADKAMAGKSNSEPMPDAAARDITKVYTDAGSPRRTLVSRIHATKAGELFLYVNDGWPQPFVDTYANNSGTATVHVKRLP